MACQCMESDLTSESDSSLEITYHLAARDFVRTVFCGYVSAMHNALDDEDLLGSSTQAPDSLNMLNDVVDFDLHWPAYLGIRLSREPEDSIVESCDFVTYPAGIHIIECRSNPPDCYEWLEFIAPVTCPMDYHGSTPTLQTMLERETTRQYFRYPVKGHCSTTMIGIFIFRASADIRLLFRLADITHVANPRRLSFDSRCGTRAKRCSQLHSKLDNDLKIEDNVFDVLVSSFVYNPQTRNDVDYGPLGTIHIESSDCNDDLVIEVEDTSLVSISEYSDAIFSLAIVTMMRSAKHCLLVNIPSTAIRTPLLTLDNGRSLNMIDIPSYGVLGSIMNDLPSPDFTCIAGLNVYGLTGSQNVQYVQVGMVESRTLKEFLSMRLRI